MKKEPLTKINITIVLSAAVIFYGLTIIFPGSFLVFILYETLALLFALISLGILWIRRKQKRYAYLFFAMLISILAAAVQAMHDVQVLFVVTFDNNGLFHLIQTSSIPLFYLGIREIALDS